MTGFFPGALQTLISLITAALWSRLRITQQSVLEMIQGREIVETCIDLPRFKPSILAMSCVNLRKLFILSVPPCPVKSRMTLDSFNKCLTSIIWTQPQIWLTPFLQGTYHFLRKRDMYSTKHKSFFKSYKMLMLHSHVSKI